MSLEACGEKNSAGTTLESYKGLKGVTVTGGHRLAPFKLQRFTGVASCLSPPSDEKMGFRKRPPMKRGSHLPCPPPARIPQGAATSAPGEEDVAAKEGGASTPSSLGREVIGRDTPDERISRISMDVSSPDRYPGDGHDVSRRPPPTLPDRRPDRTTTSL